MTISAEHRLPMFVNEVLIKIFYLRISVEKENGEFYVMQNFIICNLEIL